MPKKKRPRKPVRRSGSSHRPPVHLPDETHTLRYSPARSLLMLTDRGEADEDMVAILSTWPYRVVDASDRGRTLCLNDVAAESGEDLMTAARTLVAMEDENFLLWQETQGAYWLLVPNA